MKVKCVLPIRSQIGEGAVWDDRAGVLWWVDIPAGLIHRYDPETSLNHSFEFGEPVGCVAVRDRGGLVVASKSGFWFFDPATGARQAAFDLEGDRPLHRFNDGTTDFKGRFWAGTMKDGGEPEAVGGLYRLDPDGNCKSWRDGFYTTNGLAFSPDGGTMYFSDSHPRVRTIWTCTYDLETGRLGEPQIFFDMKAVAGRPDGGTIDADGYYWIAGVGGWQLYRFTPEGVIDMTIDLPVEKPSKPMFGGPDLDILFVTSLSVGLTEGTEDQQPDAGALFAITELGVRGLPQARFAG